MFCFVCVDGDFVDFMHVFLLGFSAVMCSCIIYYVATYPFIICLIHHAYFYKLIKYIHSHSPNSLLPSMIMIIIFSSSTHTQGLVGAPACGDVMKLQIEVDENGNIQESKFKTFGCGSAIASSSVATEWVKGKHVDEVLAIKNTDIAAHLKLPPVKLHCSMLAEDAIRAAVSDWKAKKEGKVNAAA